MDLTSLHAKLYWLFFCIYSIMVEKINAGKKKIEIVVWFGITYHHNTKLEKQNRNQIKNPSIY